MNFEKFSERSRGFVQAAQTIALRENHQRFLPEHLLKALLDDDQGLAANLIAAAGGDAAQARAAVEAALAKLPRVEGGDLIMDTQTAKVLAEAEKLAKGAGDSFVTVERLLTALAVTKSGANDALKAAGVTAQGLNAAINDVRKGRTADTASAEQGYDALKKYARDLTEAAREGKIDPIIGRDEEIRRAMQVLSAAHEEQPGADRRAGRRQDGDRRRAWRFRIVNGDVPDSIKRTRSLLALDMGSLIAGAKVSRRVRGAAEGGADRGDGGGRRGDPVHRRDAHAGGRGQGRGRDGRVEHAEAGAGAGRVALRRCDDARRVPQAHREGCSTGAAVPTGVRERADGRRHHQRSCAASRRSTRCTTGCASPIRRWSRRRRSAHRYIADRFLPDKAIDLMDEAASSRLRMEVDSASPRNSTRSTARSCRSRSRLRR